MKLGRPGTDRSSEEKNENKNPVKVGHATQDFLLGKPVH